MDGDAGGGGYGGLEISGERVMEKVEMLWVGMVYTYVYACRESEAKDEAVLLDAGKMGGVCV